MLRTKFIPYSIQMYVVYLFLFFLQIVIISTEPVANHDYWSLWRMVDCVCDWPLIQHHTMCVCVCVCVVDTKDNRNFQNWIITLLTMSLYVASKYVVVNHRSSKLKQKVLFCLLCIWPSLPTTTIICKHTSFHFRNWLRLQNLNKQ